MAGQNNHFKSFSNLNPQIRHSLKLGFPPFARNRTISKNVPSCPCPLDKRVPRFARRVSPVGWPGKAAGEGRGGVTSCLSLPRPVPYNYSCPNLGREIGEIALAHQPNYINRHRVALFSKPDLGDIPASDRWDSRITLRVRRMPGRLQ